VKVKRENNISGKIKIFLKVCQVTYDFLVYCSFVINEKFLFETCSCGFDCWLTITGVLKKVQTHASFRMYWTA